MRRVIFAFPLLAFLGIAVYFWAGLQRDPRIIPSNLIDQPVPEFNLTPLHTDKPGFASKDLMGQVSLVNIFSSWCMPCRIEHPFLMQISEKGDVPIFGIAWKDRPEDAAALLAELGNPYTLIGQDPNNKTGIELGVYGVPETYIIDTDGRIRFKHVGPILPEALKTIEHIIADLKE